MEGSLLRSRFFWDVTQRSPQRNFFGGAMRDTPKTAAEETKWKVNDDNDGILQLSQNWLNIYMVLGTWGTKASNLVK